jgi:hypothetical protein
MESARNRTRDCVERCELYRLEIMEFEVYGLHR